MRWKLAFSINLIVADENTGYTDYHRMKIEWKFGD